MNRNRGAEQLRAAGVSVRHIAERLGLKAASQVHRWLQCTELPSMQRRVQIEAAWPAVRQGLWDELVDEPTAAPTTAAAPRTAPTPARPPAQVAAAIGAASLPPRPALVAPTAAPAPALEPGTVGTVVEEARAQVERLRKMQREAEIDDTALSVRVAIERELRAALAQLAAMTGALTPSDEERILRSDAWTRCEGAITEAARGLPDTCTRADVCRALAAALDGLKTGPAPDAA